MIAILLSAVISALWATAIIFGVLILVANG